MLAQNIQLIIKELDATHGALTILSKKLTEIETDLSQVKKQVEQVKGGNAKIKDYLMKVAKVQM